MGKFDGILICTDLDGTLLRNDKSVSDENKKAIEYFKSEGGIFTFVTGRMPFFVFDIYENVMPNAPFGCINGGGVYDYSNREYVWQSTMPGEVFELVRLIDEKFPNVGIQVNTFSRAHFCKENRTMERFRELTGAPNYVCRYSEVGDPIAKVLFGSESESEIQEIAKTLKEHPKAYKFDFIRSEKSLYEILPKGIGKGTSLSKLEQHLGIDINKTIAIGDYDNDISMFEVAKLGIAVSNACPAAKEAADYVTVSNEEDAVAKVIYDLADGKITI